VSAQKDLDFLRKLQRLLAEGEFVATYKYALIQALADLSVEKEPGINGSLRLSVYQIAEKFIELYWRQAMPFRPNSKGQLKGILKQNTGAQAAIVNRVAAERTLFGGSISSARHDTKRWNRLVKDVASTVRGQPLWKLQTIGREQDEFLYRREGFSDDSITLLPGVATSLRSFYGLVTNLVRGGWLGQVRSITANHDLIGDQGNLEEFLFGSERRNLAGFRKALRAYQHSSCFYCNKQVRNEGEADHFIPWSRFPVDLGHNFVFAHTTCNNAKRDYLAHADHLAQWRETNLDSSRELTARLNELALPHDLDRTKAIASWAYEEGEKCGAHWWLKKKELQPLNSSWHQALSPSLKAAEERGVYSNED
jgi:5-methylcytosine-specific restriction endonuclease McrA